MHFASFDDICSEPIFLFNSNWYVPLLYISADFWCTGSSKWEERCEQVQAWQKCAKSADYFKFLWDVFHSVDLVSIFLFKILYFTPTNPIYRVFSVKFSGSGTRKVACHSRAHPSAIMSDLHVFLEEEEIEEQSFYCREATKSVLDIGESSSQLN